MSMYEYIVSTYIWSVYLPAWVDKTIPLNPFTISMVNKHSHFWDSLSEDVMMHIPSEKQNFPILM